MVGQHVCRDLVSNPLDRGLHSVGQHVPGFEGFAFD
jgi:predicted thioesterase